MRPVPRKLFLLRPSAWALFTGGLAATAINLLTGALANAFGDRQTTVIIAALLLLGAAFLFGWLSVALEEIREQAKTPQEFERRLKLRGEGRKGKLRRLSPVGLLSVGLLTVGILMLILP